MVKRNPQLDKRINLNSIRDNIIELFLCFKVSKAYFTTNNDDLSTPSYIVWKVSIKWSNYILALKVSKFHRNNASLAASHLISAFTLLLQLN